MGVVTRFLKCCIHATHGNCLHVCWIIGQFFASKDGKQTGAGKKILKKF